MTKYYDNVYINNKYSLLGSTRYDPIVKSNVDNCINDYYIGQKTIELAESKYQEITIEGLLKKSKLKEKNIELLISSDLQNQNLCSTLGASKFKIPYLGIYSACAGFTEGLIVASSLSKNAIVTVSSHNLVSEKQFRFPVEYGALRKMVNTCTSTGSISVLVSNNESNIRIESSTIGRVITMGHTDPNDMGSAMAPSCAETLHDHLKDTGRNPNYYDLVLTGDLGIYGLKIMKEYYKKKYKVDLSNVNIIDSGSMYFTKENIYAGASGPLCLPLIFFDYILPMKKYNKILLIATGSLHSVLSSNLKLEMPGVSHIVSVEVKY